MIKELEGREIVFKSLCGSRNYNLNLPDSDYDYKIYVLPSYNDLYEGKKYIKAYKNKENNEEGTIYDIRTLPGHLLEPAINFLEILYQKQIIANKSKYYIDKFISNLFSMRNDITYMNLPKLYHTSHSTIVSNYTKLLKDKENNSKFAAHILRLDEFLYKFNNDFSFEDSIKFKDNDIFRKMILELRSNKTVNESIMIKCQEIVDNEYKDKDKFMKKFDQNTYDKLCNVVQELVKCHIRNLVK